MQFQIGDRVVHPVHGVGTVKSITLQQFVGDKALPYYEVVTQGTTVWVPVDAQGLTRLRGIVSKSSLGDCRRLLMSAPTPLDKNHRMRQLEIATRLKDGSLTARCAMLRDLRAFSSSKPLGEAEDALLKRISKVLGEEWAASAGMTVQAALNEIEDLLQASHPSQPAAAR